MKREPPVARPPRCARRGAARGFTLIQLSVALAGLAVVAAAVTPSIVAMNRNRLAERTVRDIQSILDAARWSYLQSNTNSHLRHWPGRRPRSDAARPCGDVDSNPGNNDVIAALVAAGFLREAPKTPWGGAHYVTGFFGCALEVRTPLGAIPEEVVEVLRNNLPTADCSTAPTECIIRTPIPGCEVGIEARDPELCEEICETECPSPANRCLVSDRVDCDCQPPRPRVCEDANPCTDNSCNPATGCVFPANTIACDDGNNRTHNDRCSGGTCAGTPYGCDESNPCRTPIYHGDGQCTDWSIGAPPTCCAHAGQCADGDGNPCTTPRCESNVCTERPNAGAGCSDGNACTSGEFCRADGTCGGGGAVGCNDNNACTNDSCDPSAGCRYVPNSNACNDGNACTAGDTCSNGSCSSGYDVCRACSLPWGGTLPHAQSTTAYAAGAVGCGQSCTSQARTCNDGNLTGSYRAPSCSAQACAACALPWGGSLGHGGSVTAYAADWVPCGGWCRAEVRTCNNGQLSGSFGASWCTVGGCCDPNCPDLGSRQCGEAVYTGCGAYCGQGTANCQPPEPPCPEYGWSKGDEQGCGPGGHWHCAGKGDCNTPGGIAVYCQDFCCRASSHSCCWIFGPQMIEQCDYDDCAW